ncbi:MAG: hypothetical protein A2845_02935 [Candidatus Lloydbacteria bacterium RIFCSPHIGHO2_01_FULL_49_22]|uniref:Uncharacterized protein n=1 Tax=Candidatus Lloydbacteria bacterium RIFCSPHIGHO2_01_FULL_49_22 TaxID=1798658 RepID=A0A1G2CV69_9BACT|nr:MAG: hypothetical protein A2845_02935 [Candidatus Lloydbacteria bacterium RIFCSPHIGHO2_01_FULL_49_22]OGZ10396.1 MAG: hypothetical protein A3C14_02635 [Candidatus Lloydbacteria bacterium RIFCSPHIGHO2_02_FULL_50_18]
MKKFIIGMMLVGPAVASAATVLTGIADLVNSVQGIISLLIPLLMGLAVVAFFWGLVKYIANASDEAAKEQGKTLMIWGMVAIFVMVALWGILGWAQTQLGLTGTITTSTPPAFAVPGV